MKHLCQKWKVKLSFRGALNRSMAWPDWPRPPLRQIYATAPYTPIMVTNTGRLNKHPNAVALPALNSTAHSACVRQAWWSEPVHRRFEYSTGPSYLDVSARKWEYATTTTMKKRSERRKHCALAVVRRSQKNSPAADPLSGGAGPPKFNQLEMVTTFTYRPSLVKINARNFELPW